MKVAVNAAIQYTDKSVNLKQSHSLPKSKMNKTPLSPKTVAMANKYKEELTKKGNDYKRDINTPPVNAKGKFGKNANAVSKGNAIAQSIKEKFNYKVSKTMGNNEKKEEKKEKEEEEDLDTSVIDAVLIKEIEVIDPNFKEFMKNYEEKNPLSEISDIKEKNELMIKTKDNVSALLEYQNDYYEYLKKAIQLNNQLREILVKNNEKYRTFFKRKNRLNEQYSSNDVKNQFIVSLNRGENKKLTDIVPLKRKEIEVYKKIFNKAYKENDIKKFLDTKAQKEKKEIEVQDALLKLVKNVINKYGPLGKLITKANSNEEDLEKMNEVIGKYNLPNEQVIKEKEENEDEVEAEAEKEEEKQEEKEEVKQVEEVVKDVSENIIGGTGTDEIDVKLNETLIGFYSKKKVPKLMFKKISAGNYEYGTQKVTVKIVGEAIQIKGVGGTFSVDKFVDLNAFLEDKKMKMKNMNKGNPASVKGKAKGHKAF